MNLIDKDNAQAFEGWGNESGINKEEKILADMLKRNSAKGSLPSLRDLKIRSTSPQDIHNQVRLQGVRSNHKTSNTKFKSVYRFKTEISSQFHEDAKLPLKKKLFSNLNQQQASNAYQTIVQEQIQVNKSQLTNFKAQSVQKQTYYPKSNQVKRNNSIKHVKILEAIATDKDNQLSMIRVNKMHLKTYMKLSNLQILNENKPNIYRQPSLMHNLTSKNRITEEPFLKRSKNMHKSGFMQKYEIEEKMSKVYEKLKQTFLKFDAFEKDKKKKQTFFKQDNPTQLTNPIAYSISQLKTVDKSLFKRIGTSKDTTIRRDTTTPLKITKQKYVHSVKLTID